ncbi:MAG: LL-diaminopimelate aminotransferase [Deltaproteobacteria bacterium]|nr:MAG: LL-diaminopimelate aminotransferase [Deltaproteobacteria bacterium]
MFEKAERLKKLPPYLFKELDRKRDEAISKGVDVIDLGVGDPDLPTPEPVVEEMKRAVQDSKNHRYPSYVGMIEFRKAVAEWYKNRFGVSLDPENEVLSLIGSKEGIAHFPLAFVNPGDIVLVPTPAYPVYNISTIFAGGTSFFMPLLEENHFLPDLSSIPTQIAEKAKIMFINYPNNPTSAVADKDFFKEVVEFAKKYGIIVCHDAAYTEISFDGYVPPSILEVDGAKEVAVEFHSLSKTYNMTGWRIGFAVGNAELISALGAVKSNIDSGVFQAVQIAAIRALRLDRSWIKETVDIYKKRRDLLVEALNNIGLKVKPPKATFYLWIKVPEGYSSEGFASKLLDEAGIVVTPGNGFGEPGEGYIRISLTQKDERLKEAVDRIKRIRI